MPLTFQNNVFVIEDLRLIWKAEEVVKEVVDACGIDQDR
jgi:hypothetical protein